MIYAHDARGTGSISRKLQPANSRLDTAWSLVVLYVTSVLFFLAMTRQNQQFEYVGGVTVALQVDRVMLFEHLREVQHRLPQLVRGT